MSRNPLPALLIAATLALPASAALAQAPAQAAATADGTLLSVSASGEATRVPDVATLSAGVVTQAADANQALRANAAQMSEVMAAIKAAGIAERDIQTSGLNVFPQYNHRGEGEPVITGYQASNTVNLTLRDVARMGEVMDALVGNGANQIHGPSFSIDRIDEAQDEARRQALDKARARADMYAQSLGMRVRRIVSISEGGGFMRPMPMMRAQAASTDMLQSSPVSPGESTVSVNLDVVFELAH